MRSLSTPGRRTYVVGARLVTYALILPAVLLMGLFFYIPILRTFQSAFSATGGRFSLGNFQALAQDHVFGQIMMQTMAWIGMFVLFTTTISLLMALILNIDFKGKRLVRALVMLPWALSYPVSAMIWKWMLHPELGLFNYTLRALHLTTQNTPWLATPRLAFMMIMLVAIWGAVPFYALVLLAGLQSIPREPYEASSMDGASTLRQFVSVTLPALMPVFLVAVLMQLVYVSTTFPVIWVLTRGGPINSTHILVTYMYEYAFSFLRHHIASAMAIINMSLMVGLCAVAIYFLRKRGA